DPDTGAVRGRTDGDVILDRYDLSTAVDTGMVDGHGGETLAALTDPFQRVDEENGVRVIRTRDASLVISVPRATVVDWVGGHGRYLVAQETGKETAFTTVDWRGY